MAYSASFIGWEKAEPILLLEPPEDEEGKSAHLAPEPEELVRSWAERPAFVWSEQELVSNLPALRQPNVPAEVPPVLLDDTSLVRENVFTMARLRDMKRRLKVDKDTLGRKRGGDKKTGIVGDKDKKVKQGTVSLEPGENVESWSDQDFQNIPLAALQGSLAQEKKAKKDKGGTRGLKKEKDKATNGRSKKLKQKSEVGGIGGAEHDYVSASKAVEPMDPMVCYTLDIPERYLPSASTMTSSQAAMEVVSLIQIHAGYDSLSSLTTSVLTDITIEFLRRMGQHLAKESEAASMAATSLLIKKRRKLETPQGPLSSSSLRNQGRFVSTSERQMGLREVYQLPLTGPTILRRESVDSTAGEAKFGVPPSSGVTKDDADEEKEVVKKEPLQENQQKERNGAVAKTGEDGIESGRSQPSPKKAQAVPISHPPVGGKKHATKKVSTPKVSEQSREEASREAVVAYKSLLQFGCSLKSLEQFLIRIIKFGDGLRIIDRKMLKKGNKLKKPSATEGKQRKARDGEDSAITPDMIHALLEAQLGSSLLETKKKASLVSPSPLLLSPAASATPAPAPSIPQSKLAAKETKGTEARGKSPGAVSASLGQAKSAGKGKKPLASPGKGAKSGQKGAAASAPPSTAEPVSMASATKELYSWPPKFDDSPTKVLAAVADEVVPPPEGEIDLMSLDSIFEAGFVLPLDGEMLPLDASYDLQALEQQ